MSEAERLLARTRLELRRESGTWQRSEPRVGSDPGDAVERIQFYPDASMDTAFSLSQATLMHDVASLLPTNRVRSLKRILLRIARFYTDRQVRFNSSVVQVLNGYAKLLNRHSEASESLKHETVSHYRSLESHLGRVDAGFEALRASIEDGRETTAQLLATEVARLSSELSVLREKGELRDEALRELTADLSAVRSLGDRSTGTLRELTGAMERHEHSIGDVRAALATAVRDFADRADRHTRSLQTEIDAVQAARHRHEELLQGLGAVAARASTMAEHHEGVLGDIREALATLRAASERQDRALQDVASEASVAEDVSTRLESRFSELRDAVGFLRGASGAQQQATRDGLASLRSTIEIHERELEAASATASAAADATRRIDRSLEELAPIAHAAKRDVSLNGSAIGELHGGLAALRRAHEGQENALQDASATARAASDATRRIDRELVELSGTASRFGRDLGVTLESIDAVDSRLDAAQAELSSLVRRGRGLHSDRVAQLYARFEERFRGSPQEIRERVEIYAQRVARVLGQFPGLPFLDLGCGRGELVAALRDAGIAAEGVEANPIFAEACRDAGIQVHESDLFEELRGRPDGSLAGISAIQVVEHLQAEALVELLELARAKIVESGLLVLETIDVRSLYALRWFFADPTHVLPLMPETLGFYVESAGFTEIEVVPLHPVPEPVAPPVGGGKRIERLTEVVFGPQDFALLARRAPVRRLAAVAAPSEAPLGKSRTQRRPGRGSSMPRVSVRQAKADLRGSSAPRKTP